MLLTVLTPTQDVFHARVFQISCFPLSITISRTVPKLAPSLNRKLLTWILFIPAPVDR
jgi:hypothetical protein